MTGPAFVSELNWVTGQPVKTVIFDAVQSRVEVQFSSGRVEFEGIAATTLMGPWDGKPGAAEWLRCVHQGAGQSCFELRIAFGPIPRVFRIVCQAMHEHRDPAQF